ncbi:MAG TPA: amidohydrolase family protein [Kofleriaceae bacterium]|nr:amidohydrolase family protein [Kofleriaceae bacterium]
MRTVALSGLVIVAACSGPPRALPPPAGPDVPVDVDATPAAEPNEAHWVVVSSGKNVGTFDLTIAPDGAAKAVYHVLENGRGPHNEATLRFGTDGGLDAFEATGHFEMGTPVKESMQRSGNRARWTSTVESGEREVAGAAFYLPSSDVPMKGFLVRAAVAAGGQLTVLPSGEARVEKVTDVEVKNGDEQRTLACYRLSGLSFAPEYQWMNADGSWFGSTTAWRSVVPAGWEGVVDTLNAERRAIEQAWSRELAATHAHEPPVAGLAYVHARVLDVEKGKWLVDHTVIVDGGTIATVGPSKRVKVPPGAEVVDLTGKTLIPGLVDMHGHVEPIDGLLNIASGVTTVRDVGGDHDELEALKRDWDSGATIGPHLVRMGFIEGRNEKAAASKITAETPDEAKQAVAFYAERGYEGVKIYNSVKPELVPVIAAEAHARKMLVTGHIPVHMLAHEAVKAGYDGIEHINMLFLNFLATHETDTRDTTRFTLVGEQGHALDFDSKPVKDFLALLKSKGTVIAPTVATFEELWAAVPGEITPGMGDLVARLPMRPARDFLKGGLPIDKEMHATYLKSWDHVLALVKKLHDSGIPIVLGTDHIPGVMLHHEAELWARAGIKNADIVRQATLGAARAMRQDKSFGSIAKGKRADLVVLDGDPLVDIHALGRVVSTMRGGVTYASAPLYKAAGVKPLVE